MHQVAAEDVLNGIEEVYRVKRSNSQRQQQTRQGTTSNSFESNLTKHSKIVGVVKYGEQVCISVAGGRHRKDTLDRADRFKALCLMNVAQCWWMAVALSYFMGQLSIDNDLCIAHRAPRHVLYPVLIKCNH